MSLTAGLRPTSLSFGSTTTSNVYATLSNATSTSLQHDSNYLAVCRILLRYQSLILLLPVSSGSSENELSPLQRRIQAELWSPLPYHRTKWLHNIDGARNLLLQLERTTQGIKLQRAKKDALKDIAEKRALVKKLRSRVEDIGRQVEAMGDKAWDPRNPEDDILLGERVSDVLAGMNPDTSDSRHGPESEVLYEGKPITNVAEEVGGQDDQSQRNTLFEPSIRRRTGRETDSVPNASALSKGETSGFSNLPATEKELAASSRTHEDLAASMVSMAAQLKQQAMAFQFSLDQDKGLLDRALEGLDKNLTGMEAASKNMAFLRRMSEGEGWLGRLKLYGIIFAMWISAILLVFVGPKLRF